MGYSHELHVYLERVKRQYSQPHGLTVRHVQLTQHKNSLLEIVFSVKNCNYSTTLGQTLFITIYTMPRTMGIRH